MKHLKLVPFVIVLLISGAYLLSIPDLPLGPLYDMLMQLRPRLEAPPDLVVIDTKGEALETLSSEDAVRVLKVLSAMQSRLAVFQTRVSLPDESQSFSSTDRQQLVQKEFSLIQNNISNLFDGIRLGSIRPQDAQRYVRDVNALVDESKNRLLLTINESGSTRALELEKARALFHQVILCDDLEWADTRANALEIWGGQAVYSKVDRDSDGILRRMYPVKELPNKTLLHAGMAVLMQSIGGDVKLNHSGMGLQLVTENERYELPLDTQGRLLVHRPESYKSVPVSDLKTYLDQEKKLYEALKEMERAGYFINLDALQYPTTLYEYAQSLEQEAMENPLPDKVRQWREARHAFYISAAFFLQGPEEQKILAGYDKLLETEALQEGGKERIASLKELASQAFGWARKAQDELMVLHTRLESLLRDGYCVIGSTAGDADATVTLLSTILSRSFINPGRPLYLLLAGFAGLALLYIATFIFSPPWFFIFSIILAMISFLITAGLFVMTGYWYAPMLPVIMLLGAAVLYVLMQAFLLRYIRRHQELALKYRMAPDAFRAFVCSIPLKQLSSVPTPADIQERDALIICVRHASFLGEETAVPLKQFAEDVKRFRHKTSELLKRFSGTILWMDGEVLFAALGFPQIPTGSEAEIAREALRAAQALEAAFPDEPVTIGMDYGKTAFYFDVLSGYSALGRVPVHARVLSGLAGRYKTRVLCTEGALSFLKQSLGEPVTAEAIDILVDKQEQRDIRFFAITYNGRSGS